MTEIGIIRLWRTRVIGLPGRKVQAEGQTGIATGGVNFNRNFVSILGSERAKLTRLHAISIE